MLADHRLEAVTQKERRHIVKMGFATVDKLGEIAILAQQSGQGKKVILGQGQFDHTARWRGWIAADHRLDAPHRAGTGGVQLLEPPALMLEFFQLGGNGNATQRLDKGRAQALLQHYH